MILGKPSALVCALTLVLALAACSGDEPTGRSAPGVTETAAAPAPTLPEGPLEVVARHGKVRELGGLDDTGLLVTDELVITIDQPANSMAAYAREDAAEQWRVTLPRNGAQACFDPLLAAPDRVVVFIGAFCELLVAYDVATGKQVHRERIVATWVDEAGNKHREPTSPGDLPSYAAVTGAVALDGRVWYSTQKEVGYLDEDTEPVWVLDGDALGLVDDAAESSHPSGLGVRAEDDLLVVEILVSDQQSAQFEGRNVWLGVKVTGDDEPEARIAWTLDEADGSTLGIEDLAGAQAPILLRATEPGAVVAVGLTGKRVGLGVPDAETGAVGNVAVVPKDREVSVTDSGPGGSPQLAWSDGTLFTTSDASGETFRRWIDAWDLATGKERWRVQVPAPGGQDTSDGYYVHSVQVAPDGAVHAVTTDAFMASTLYRLDAATGEVTGTWDLPETMATAEHRVTVVDGTVYALATDTGLDPIPGLTVLRSSGSAPTP